MTEAGHEGSLDSSRTIAQLKPIGQVTPHGFGGFAMGQVEIEAAEYMLGELLIQGVAQKAEEARRSDHNEIRKGMGMKMLPQVSSQFDGKVLGFLVLGVDRRFYPVAIRAP